MNIPKNIVCLDFETYYDTNYTLTKLGNTEYIYDERFKIHGLGVRYGAQRKSRWYTGDDICRVLHKIQWKCSYLLCHHAHFDGLILYHHFGIQPQFYLDTLSMSRFIYGMSVKHDLDSLSKRCDVGSKLPDILESSKGIRDLPTQSLKKLGEYCNNDVDITDKVFRLLVKHYPKTELDIINMTIRMFCAPKLMVNKNVLYKELDKEEHRKKTLLEKCGPNITQKILHSANKFANNLRIRGIVPPTKISLRTGKETYAFAKTDPEFIELLNCGIQTVENLVAARMAAKNTIIETRCNTLLRRTIKNIPIPIYLNYNGTGTGRFSGGDKLNPQNFPSKRTGSKIRTSLTAPDGYVLGIADAAQIEARFNAWFCNQEDLLHIFAIGGDPYKEMASVVYKAPTEEITDAQRFIGKTAILGLGYQCGAPTYKKTLEMGVLGPPVIMSLIESKEIVNTFRNKNYNICNMWGTLQNTLWGMYHEELDKKIKCVRLKNNHVILPNGKHIIYNNLTYESINSRTKKLFDVTYQYRPTEKRNLYGGKELENIIQGLANVSTTAHMLKISERYKPVMMTHDEVICIIPENEAEEGLNFMLSEMGKSPKWAPDIPLKATGEISKFYSK